MDAFKNHELAINWKLFKQCKYSHIIFDSNLSGNMKWNSYQISLMIAIVTYISLLIFGSMGFFINLDVTFTYLDYIMIFYAYIHLYFVFYKLCILMYNKNKLWNIFGVSHIKFLKSTHCVKNRIILHTHRNETIKITNIFCIFSIYTIGVWIVSPLVAETFMPNTETERIQNIVNFPYPFTISTYNKYYIIFYLIEAFLCVFFVYSLFMVDLFLLSFGWVIVTQYTVINRAFSNIGQDYDSGMNKLA